MCHFLKQFLDATKHKGTLHFVQYTDVFTLRPESLHRAQTLLPLLASDPKYSGQHSSTAALADAGRSEACSKSFCSIKSTILLEIKCPQLSKPEATAARNQNSIGDRMEKKTLGETRLSRGAISPLARRHSSSIATAAKSDWRAHLVPEILSWWLSRWRGPHWGSVSGAHLGVLVSTDVQGCRGRL